MSRIVSHVVISRKREREREKDVYRKRNFNLEKKVLQFRKIIVRSEDTYLLFLVVCNALFFKKSTHIREPSTKLKLFVAREFKRLNGKTKRIPHPFPSKKETSSIRSACESFNFQIEFCQGNFPLPFPARVTRLIDPFESLSTSKSRSLQPSGMMYRQFLPPPPLSLFFSHSSPLIFPTRKI